MILHLFLVFIFLFNLTHASEHFNLKGVVIGYGNMGQLHAAHFSSLCESIEIVEIDEHKIKLALEHGYTVYNSLAVLGV